MIDISSLKNLKDFSVDFLKGLASWDKKYSDFKSGLDKIHNAWEEYQRKRDDANPDVVRVEKNTTYLKRFFKTRNRPKTTNAGDNNPGKDKNAVS
jgi:uncharacterized protein YijF (DUF1287 family)